MVRFKTVCLDCRGQNCHNGEHRLVDWSSKLTVPSKGNERAWKLIESGDHFWDKRKVSRKGNKKRVSLERNHIARLAKQRQMKAQLRLARDQILERGDHSWRKSDFVDLVSALGDDSTKPLLNAIAYRVFELADEIPASALMQRIDSYLAK